MRIYLAGGMRRGWRDEVIAGMDKRHIFYDPTRHGLQDEDAYTAWDLMAIRECDYVFAYMEPDNPSGVGMALELGYAAALGKTIFFVDCSSSDRTRYFGMCRVVSKYVFATLADGIKTLNIYCNGIYK